MVFTMFQGTTLSASANEKDNSKKQYTVLVLDTSNEASFLDWSGSVFYTAPTAIEYVKKAASKFLANLSLSVDENHVAIVSYKDTATIVSDFSNDFEKLNADIKKLYASSDTRDISAGLSVAQTLLNKINDSSVNKNVVLFTTGMTNAGNYSYDGYFDENTVGSNWYRADNGIHLYAYANYAFDVASNIKSSGATLYTIGLFQTMNEIPELGKDIAEFFQLTSCEFATSDKFFFPVDDPEKLELTFGEVADVINNIATVTGILGDYTTVVILNSDESYDAVEINNHSYKIADKAVTKEWVKENKGRTVKAILINDEIKSITSYLSTGIDNNAFSHWYTSFFSNFSQTDYSNKTSSERQKYTKQFKYEISDEKFKDLLDWCSEFYTSAEKNKFNKKLLKKERNSAWGGSCFGISASMALSYKETIDLSDIYGSESHYYQVGSSNNPSQNSNLKDLINYYQLAQYVNAWQHYKLTENGGIVSQSQEEKNAIISSMIEYALKCDAVGEPFIIGMHYSHDATDENGNPTRDSGGHAILGVGVQSSDENTTTIRVVDPNNSEYNYMILSQDPVSGDYSIDFENDYTASLNYDFDSINYVSMDELRVVDYYNDLYSDRYDFPTSTFMFGSNEDITIIDKETGKKFVYHKGEVSGDITIYDIYKYYTSTSETEEYEIGFELELGNNYELITDGKIDITVGNSNGFVGVDVTNGYNIDLDLNSGFTITGDEIEYNIFVDLNNSENLINISGTGKDSISVQETDSSVIIKGNDLYLETSDYLYENTIISNDYNIDVNSNTIVFSVDNNHIELQNICKLCGKDHGNSLIGRLITFFHKIAYFFTSIFSKLFNISGIC